MVEQKREYRKTLNTRSSGCESFKCPCNLSKWMRSRWLAGRESNQTPQMAGALYHFTECVLNKVETTMYSVKSIICIMINTELLMLKCCHPKPLPPAIANIIEHSISHRSLVGVQIWALNRA